MMARHEQNSDRLSADHLLHEQLLVRQRVERLGRMKLTRPLTYIIWFLRLYVLMMIGLVGFDIWRTLH